MEIRWLWREQWPFKDFESRQKNSWLNARYILQEMTPRPPDVCFAAAGADFASAGAFLFLERLRKSARIDGLMV